MFSLDVFEDEIKIECQEAQNICWFCILTNFRVKYRIGSLLNIKIITIVLVSSRRKQIDLHCVNSTTKFVRAKSTTKFAFAKYKPNQNYLTLLFAYS